MEKDITTVTPHPASCQTSAEGLTSEASPNCKKYAEGQSVENVPMPKSPSKSSLVDSLKWFVVRATRGRAQEVYDELVGLGSPHLELYIPSYHHESLKIVDGMPQKIVKEGTLHNGLVFVRTTRAEFYKLVHGLESYPFIPGLTPYYDHFHEYEIGRNDYLVVPDKQFQDFRTILESGDTHILVDQEDMPSYLNGKKVEVVSGPFEGVIGTLLRWGGLRRVFIQLDYLGTFATGFIRTCDFRLLE